MKRVRILTGLIIAALICSAAFALAYRQVTRELPFDARRVGLKSLEMKIQAYYLDTNSLPRSLDGLVIPDGSRNWRGPYAKSGDLHDPWGRPFAYEPLDAIQPHFRLTAFDASGKPVVSETSP